MFNFQNTIDILKNFHSNNLFLVTLIGYHEIIFTDCTYKVTKANSQVPASVQNANG